MESNAGADRVSGESLEVDKEVQAGDLHLTQPTLTLSNEAPGDDTSKMDFVHSLDGRKHRRVPIMVVVRLSSLQNPPSELEERTYTDNVSAHGACVISAHAWQPGEEAKVTSVKDGTTIRGRVIHCQKLEDARFGVGLNFAEEPVPWSSYKKYNGV